MGTKVYNNLPKFSKEIDDYRAFNPYPANVENMVSS